MKRQFARLSKAQQEKVEAKYHGMKPEEFDEAMARAKPHRTGAHSGRKRKSKATEKKRAA